ncbi:hypothetical protein [Microbacterium sp. H6]|uniref:hypothetical protein n=1 Tax=Microbacterium sp. H6 TaxID=421122 RepID=UPI0015F11828|nr:hypothetical protein [Microbacterium sp. H6]
MRFIDAVALVFSRSRRIAHGAWESWAREQVQRHGEAQHGDQQDAAHKGLGLQASDEVATAQGHGEAQQARTSAEASPWDLNADWRAFKDAGGGERA